MIVYVRIEYKMNCTNPQQVLKIINYFELQH